MPKQKQGKVWYCLTMQMESLYLKKHVYVDHCMIVKIFEEINNILKEPYEKQPTKKKPHVNGTNISNFFVTKDLYRKDDV